MMTCCVSLHSAIQYAHISRSKGELQFVLCLAAPQLTFLENLADSKADDFSKEI